VVLGDSHAHELLRAVLLVQDEVGVLLELLHVGTDEHLSKLDKVAVLLVVDLDGSPWVRAAPDLASVGGSDDVVGSDDGKRDLALQ